MCVCRGAVCRDVWDVLEILVGFGFVKVFGLYVVNAIGRCGVFSFDVCVCQVCLMQQRAAVLVCNVDISVPY